MQNSFYEIEWRGQADCLFCYTLSGERRSIAVAAPVFEIDGQRVQAALASWDVEPPVRLAYGVDEFRLRGWLAGYADIELETVLRIAPQSPVLRWRYTLHSAGGHRLTRSSGQDQLEYLALDLQDFESVSEVRFSEFDESIHSFRPNELPLDERHFDNQLAVMGPMLLASGGGLGLLAAYEHGSQVPDAFVHFRLSPPRRTVLAAVKGNYPGGRSLDADHPFETICLQMAVVPGGRAELARAYRDFVLRWLSPNSQSRQPYIFYNTWNYQERNKWWNQKTFLDSMHQARILEEIDIAQSMGIEVFVIDTGWYEKTGDWQVNRQRFPDGLKTVKERLDGYGMKLGLWFSPLQVALSSRIYQQHLDCQTSWNGEKSHPWPVWETEESVTMCLASRYWEAFADELIRLSRELGVTYFKWDAVHQYGCDDPGHFHGGPQNTPQERADCYAFESCLYLARVVDRLCAACPEAIVDFDITEGQRSVGLSFLAAGKYFLINNGPYYPNLDDPEYAPGGGMGTNVFVFPGQARPRLCRTPLGYDEWIPSVLFLTHYLPDDPRSSQLTNLASLVLGHNGIWGDLPNLSAEGVALFSEALACYKQVRAEITASYPTRSGMTGGSPEVVEKIAPNGRGLVALFASAPGSYTYITHNAVDFNLWSAGAQVKRLPSGQARLEVNLEEPGAALVFFGVQF